MNARAAYEELLRLSRERTLLESCATLLNWDEETHMPPGGRVHRAEQLALLAGLHHAWATDARIGELLTVVAESYATDDSTPEAAANIRELRRNYDRLTRLPRRLVQEKARVAALGEPAWQDARRDSDFAQYRPWLARAVALKREEAECVGYAGCPYDALLDEHEPGTTTDGLVQLFAGLSGALIPLVNRLVYARRQPESGAPGEVFPFDRQRALCAAVASAVGYDFRGGRIDTAAHPFACHIGPGDCRIAIRFNELDFTESVFTTLHEAGHALYDQGLDATHAGTPMGEAVSVGMHEGQARLWENIVGRSAGFWRHFFPIARTMFPGELTRLSVEEFHFAVNRVQPTTIRVLADAVTYDLHILIRFELERSLINGDLSVDDLPEAWNNAYRHTLGVTPANDAEGCLQDSHWVAGHIGYFPTYTLGNIYSAQLHAAAERELDSLDASFARGDFHPLREWLRERIHRHGKICSAAELVTRATGAAPSPDHLLNLLTRRYEALYEI